MIDIKFLRENPDIVKQNIKNKFQDHKLGLVDEVIELDASSRAVQQEADDLRANRNRVSKQIGALMGQGKKEEAMALKEQVAKDAERLTELEAQEGELQEKIKKIMMTIPNIIDPSVPIGKDDSENVEVERFGEPVVPDFEVPYHTEIMEKFDELIQSPVPVLVDFFAEWCGPCKAMKPILEEVKSKVGDTARIVKIDVDQHEQLAARFKIQAVPTFILFSNGESVWRHSGMIHASELTGVIEQYSHKN